MNEHRATEKALTSYRKAKNKDRDLDPLTGSSRELTKELRDPHCSKCKLTSLSSVICMFGDGPVPARGMIITSYPSTYDARDDKYLTPNSDSGAYLDAILRDSDLDRSDLYITSAVKCQPSTGKTKDAELKIAQKICGPAYLDAEIARVKPAAILALGSSAYYHFTHSQGLIKHRGQASFDQSRNTWIIPSVTPDYVMLFPNYHDLFLSDVKKFSRFINDNVSGPPVNLHPILSVGDYNLMITELDKAGTGTLTFDLETRGLIDYKNDYSKVWCAAITRGVRDSEGAVTTYILPLEHPESPFLDDIPSLRYIMSSFCDYVLSAKANGHNVKFDIRFLIFTKDRYSEVSDKELARQAESIKTYSLWSYAGKSSLDQLVVDRTTSASGLKALSYLDEIDVQA